LSARFLNVRITAVARVHRSLAIPNREESIRKLVLVAPQLISESGLALSNWYGVRLWQEHRNAHPGHKANRSAFKGKRQFKRAIEALIKPYASASHSGARRAKR